MSRGEHYCPQCGRRAYKPDEAGYCSGCEEHIRRFDTATGNRLLPLGQETALDPWSIRTPVNGQLVDAAYFAKKL